ncbi:MAG: phosphatidate cytidylyltransferase [Nitrospiraceae bacterium]|nr:phosphatidate cytidylyltransferase [Nitrospiraceae bacterium]
MASARSHLKRLIIAAIAVPLLYFYVTKLPPVYFNVLISVAGLGALYELMSFYKTPAWTRGLAIVLGAFMLLSSALTGEILSESFALAVLITLAVRMITSPPGGAMKDVSVIVAALVYIPGFISFQMLLREVGAVWIIFLYATVWSADSLAFYIGSSIGRMKLYPAVSPNKTVEGGIGSLLGGILCAVVLKKIFSLGITYEGAVIAGAVIGAVAVIGDLVESMFKRDAGVKDSSRLFPEHGGLLDKLDGSLFCGPALYWTLRFLTR